ncbi:glycosyltransferase family 25 protein [Mucilaginibacter arboris]|uniref:Glycosyl transferase family 25 domain-containing protein n=1 Tax=Mucilaginibacter arboris TaxID=2682090 RepID=A0A7K1SY49_9SPHI|nr:glycosyltransferase family 25 protein [Mucilaginibacter arboris]MVN22246.1 hypothetical protein [Mucilaginibacter arboris]
MINPDQPHLKILNTYFDKILILTIQRNANRREILKQVLGGLDYEIFYGVEGSMLKLKELIESGVVAANIQDIYKQTNIDYMNMGSSPVHINQIACSMSHIKMYQYILDNQLDKVLILEDDVMPVEENLKYLSETLNQVPDNWELLYLGHIINNNFSFWGKLKYYYFINFLYKVGIRTKSIIRKKNTYPGPFSTLLRKDGAHIGTHAYAVRGKGAVKLIKLQEPLKQAAPDLLLMDAVAKRVVVSYTSKFNFFQQNPKIHSSVWDGL